MRFLVFVTQRKRLIDLSLLNNLVLFFFHLLGSLLVALVLVLKGQEALVNLIAPLHISAGIELVLHDLHVPTLFLLLFVFPNVSIQFLNGLVHVLGVRRVAVLS